MPQPEPHWDRISLKRHWLDVLLEQLPAKARLRLDANGGWNRPKAFALDESRRAPSVLRSD